MEPAAKTSPAIKLRVSNVDVASFLLTRSFRIAAVEADGPTIFFVFDDPVGDGERVMLTFYDGAEVPANRFADAGKRIRDLLWEAKRRPKK